MTPTPKEGPPTLSDFWELINDIGCDFAEGTEFYKSYDLLESLSKKAGSYGLTLEIVERDEKRRAALEKLAEKFSEWQKLMDRYDGWEEEADRIPLITKMSDAWIMVGYAHKELDALTPATQEKEGT